MKVKVSVTDEHIRLGAPHDADRCPISLALKEQHGLEIGKLHHLALPWKAMQFMRSFDRMNGSGRFDPFEFELNTEAA